MPRRLNFTLDDETAAILARAVGDAPEAPWIRAAIIERAARAEIGELRAEIDRLSERVRHLERLLGVEGEGE